MLALCSGAARGADELVLKHDDGTMEGKRSITGGGHAVRFERPDEGPWYLDQAALFGSRYGFDQAPDEDFSVYVTDASMESFVKIVSPWVETWPVNLRRLRREGAARVRGLAGERGHSKAP